MKTSPIRDLYPNATFDTFAGSTMPASFVGIAAEYEAAHERAAIFDCSHVGKLLLTGDDVPKFLHNLATNEIEDLPLGGGCETFFCDPRAKVMAHAWIYHILTATRAHAIWVEVAPSLSPMLAKYLDRYLISEEVEIEDVSEAYAQFHIAGPDARAVLERAIQSPLPDLRNLQHMERTFGLDVVAQVRRHDALGVPGYDVICTSNRAIGIWPMLVAAGATPAGSKVFETMRIEAGMPIYGIDIDETRFVMEVARAAGSVSYNKGCYPGQEPIVMSRDRAKGVVNRAFMMLKVEDGSMLPTGSKLMKGEMSVGLITSCAHSPMVGGMLALGYVQKGNQEPGTTLEVALDSCRVPVTVLKLAEASQ